MTPAPGRRIRLAPAVFRLVSSARGWFPLTAAGVATAAVGAAIYILDARSHQDLLLGAALPLLGAVLAAALLLVLSVASVTRFRTRRCADAPQLQLEAGARVPTGYRFPFPRWFPLVGVGVRWDFPGDADLECNGGELTEFFVPARRGVINQLGRTLIFRDPTGLVEVSWSRTETVDWRVFPARRSGAASEDLPSRGVGADIPNSAGAPRGDLVEMRRYSPGDSPRLILWKAFARSRRLVVRQPEKAVEDCQRLCIWFLPGDLDEAAARSVRRLIETGSLGDGWALAAAGLPDLARSVPAAMDLLARSASNEVAPVQPATEFASFASRMRLRGYQDCLLAGPESRRADLELLAGTKWMTTRLLVAGGTPTARPTGWRRLVLRTGVPERIG